MKKIIFISNDKLYFSKKEVCADFNDTINIIESLSKRNYLYFISRKNILKGIQVDAPILIFLPNILATDWAAIFLVWYLLSDNKLNISALVSSLFL